MPIDLNCSETLAANILQLIDTDRPVQSFAGQLMALKTFMDTAPMQHMPVEFKWVLTAITACLDSIESGQGKNRNKGKVN